MNNNKPAIIICHGVGCLYVHHFLVNGIEESPGQPSESQQQAQQQQPQPSIKRSGEGPPPDEIDFKTKYVKAMIAITAPWGGYFNGLYTYLNHDNEQLFKQYPVVKAVERTFSSSAYLLPSVEVFGKDALVQTQFRNYTANDYKDVFLGLGYPNAYNMWLDGRKYSSELPHPNVDVFAMSGLGYKTMEQIVYKRAIDLSDAKNLYRRCRRRIIYGNGDGVVNLKSARRVLAWQSDPHGYKFTYTEFLAKHDDILKNTHAISHILNIVSSLKFAPDVPNTQANTYGDHHEYHSEYSGGGGHISGEHGQHGNGHNTQPEPEPFPSSAHTQGQTFVEQHHYPHHEQQSASYSSPSANIALTNGGNYSVYYHPPNTPSPPQSFGTGQDPRSSSNIYIDQTNPSYSRRPIVENNHSSAPQVIKISAQERQVKSFKVDEPITPDKVIEKQQASAGYLSSERSNFSPDSSNTNINSIDQPMAQESSNHLTKVDTASGNTEGTTTVRTLMNV